ncbi:hypothetical protein SAMN05518669_11144 [Variovorax sp. YR634]|nr:hypothetical protein SAMN05518669_11144 [Variovorax sp. YR634]
MSAHATYGGEMPHAGALQRVDYAPRFAWHPQEQNTRMSSDTPPTTLTVFFGFQRIAQGSKAEVLDQLRRRDDPGPYLVFDDQTGTQLDLDLRELLPELRDHEAEHRDDAPRGVGRPKLGVVAREVTLLPRHWDWLGRQPGGASVALRKLVDDARRVNAERDTVRAAHEATYRFMTAIAGNLPGFEEATRALFAGEEQRFGNLIEPWPADVRAHLQKLSAAGWPPQ